MGEIEDKLTSLKQFLIKDLRAYNILKELGFGFKIINIISEEDLDNLYEEEFHNLFKILSNRKVEEFKQLAEYIKILYLKKVIFADIVNLSIHFQIQTCLKGIDYHLKNTIIENIVLSCISRAYDSLNKQPPIAKDQIEIAVNEYGLIYFINKQNIKIKTDFLEPVQNLITTIIFNKINNSYVFKTCVGDVANACKKYFDFIIQNQYSSAEYSVLDPKVYFDDMIYELFEYISKSFKEINYRNFRELFNQHFENNNLDIYFEEGNDNLLKEEMETIPIYQKNLNDSNKYPKLAIHRVKNKNGIVARKIAESIYDNHKNSYHYEIKILTNLNYVDNRNQSQINHFPKFYDKSVIMKHDKIIYDMELFDDNLEVFIKKKPKK